MTLQELLIAATNAAVLAKELGEDPSTILVTLQIDDPDDPHHGYQCAEDVYLHYDGNVEASGCVLQGVNDAGRRAREALEG